MKPKYDILAAHISLLNYFYLSIRSVKSFNFISLFCLCALRHWSLLLVATGPFLFNQCFHQSLTIDFFTASWIDHAVNKI